MGVVSLDQELYEQIEEAAREHHTDVSEILQRAVRMYLWEWRREQIAREHETYLRRYRELLKRHKGQYIAMYKGEVVDYDNEFEALYQRVRDRFGNAPVLITRVEKQPILEFTREGFQAHEDSVGLGYSLQPDVAPL